MVERLNFYDLYGYLIPGIAFLALVWFPYGVGGGTLVNLDWSSALLALVFAYVAGHLLQGLAIPALPSLRKGSAGFRRYPSDILLDDDDESLSLELKRRLVRRILVQFDLDVRDNAGPDLRKKRQDAFFLCRRVLIQKGIASYAEQFEGMYALMRGLCAASILGVAYYLGLLTRSSAELFTPATQIWFRYAGLVAAPILAVAVLIAEVTTPREDDGTVFWFGSALTYLFGGFVASQKVGWHDSPTTLLVVSLVLLFVSLRTYSAYHDFSRRFAETVYRDFSAL